MAKRESKPSVTAPFPDTDLRSCLVRRLPPSPEVREPAFEVEDRLHDLTAAVNDIATKNHVSDEDFRTLAYLAGELATWSAKVASAMHLAGPSPA